MLVKPLFLWLNENPVSRRRVKETKRLKVKKTKRGRDEESKRLKVKETKRRREKGGKTKPRKPLEEYGGCAAAVMLPFWSYKSKLLTPKPTASPVPSFRRLPFSSRR